MSSNAAAQEDAVTVTPDNEPSANEEGATPASDDTTKSANTAKKADTKGRAKDKAPRPKNPFIIYRKEWHPKIVAKFPDLHNNDICKSYHLLHLE